MGIVIKSISPEFFVTGSMNCYNFIDLKRLHDCPYLQKQQTQQSFKTRYIHEGEHTYFSNLASSRAFSGVIFVSPRALLGRHYGIRLA